MSHVRARIGVAILGAALLASCSNGSTTGKAGTSAGITLSATSTATRSCGRVHVGEDLTAETQSGEVVQIEPRSLTGHIVARGARPQGGVAQRAESNQLFVTADGTKGLPSIWEIPIATCRPRARLVEARAELPSVSPDGGYLGFVTVDGRGRQTGVSIVGLDDSGRPTGAVRRLDAVTVPPPLPIQGIAVDVADRQLAVWGGFVDPYLGRHRPTVGTLEPSAARSLRSLEPVFDGSGVSLPVGVRAAKAWQAAPSYLANGEFLVWTVDGEVVMPFKVSTPGVHGGGARNIERLPGAVVSLAAGPDGSLASVGPGGVLEISRDAIDLPFGPAADWPVPPKTPVKSKVKGVYTAVAWSTGTSLQSTKPPPVFRIIEHLPSVVGLTEAKAEMVMAHLELPAFVGHTVQDPNVPSGTVLAQDPAAGTGVACQCDIALTVSTKD